MNTPLPPHVDTVTTRFILLLQRVLIHTQKISHTCYCYYLMNFFCRRQSINVGMQLYIILIQENLNAEAYMVNYDILE